MSGIGNRYSQHSFAQIPSVNTARSNFDRSFTVKDTMEFDYLNPIFVDEILPGDTINLSVQTFARLATQVRPVMDNMYLNFYFFFVPNRLVWDNFQKFMGEQKNPGDSTDFLIPTLTTRATTGEPIGGVADKFGIPTGVPGLEVNALPFRALNLIYNEWFRDQNLQDSLDVPTDDGPDLPTEYDLFKQNKAHDYFTSMLPWPQKGPAVELPLGTSAPLTITGDGTSPTMTGGVLANGNLYASTTSGIFGNFGAPVGTNTNLVWADPALSGTADLSNATAATINQLRQAFAIQSLYELDARGGTRYVEILLAHFNVVSPDFRLQRPEYLGGGKAHFNVHPVPQTAPTDGDAAQGSLAAYGTASTVGNGVGFSKSFVEHGYVIGLVSARADITYQQGLNRMWSRQTRWDFFWPKLQEIGEQAVLGKELYADGSPDDEEVEGYQERYAEYRYKPSEIHGLFRSTAPNSLDVWTLAEEFNSRPSLNGTFIQSNTPIERSIAVPSEPAILMDVWFKYRHSRAMLTYSVPSSLGRF